jgi:hypothetical protein
MNVIDELHDLQKKAMLFTLEPDREKRWKAGFWAEHQCNQLDNRYRILNGFNEEAKVELSALIKIIFDYLLYDNLEDPDWIMAMPDHYDGDIEAIVTGLRQEGMNRAS